MIIADTSGMIAAFGRNAPRHSQALAAVEADLGPIVVSPYVLGELDYMLTVVARNVSELQQVLARLAARGGQRLVTYLRLEEIKPPSRLPLAVEDVTP